MKPTQDSDRGARSKGRPATRDPDRAREKILAAALAEFSSKGLAGARVDQIARRARVNKRMLYYYYGDKRELYRQSLIHEIRRRRAMIEAMPRDPADALAYWYQEMGTDAAWVRMMEWEALGARADKLVAEEGRRGLFHKALDSLRGWQQRGLLPQEIDLTQLFISMIAVIVFPIAFPQMVRLMTGLEPTAPAFRARRLGFLRWFGARLGGLAPMLNSTNGRAKAGASGSRRGSAASPARHTPRTLKPELLP